MKNRSNISSIAYRWRSWVQILSVAFAEQKPQLISALIITAISLFLTSWIIVPISAPLFAVDIQLFLLIPSIWILVMSHLSFTERINRPLIFSTSLPAAKWQWWLSRVILTVLINAMVTGLVILAAIVWIRLAGDPSKINSNLNKGIYYTLLTTCSMAAVFFAWSATRLGYLWLVFLLMLVSRFFSDSNGVAFGVQFWPHLTVALPLGLLLSYWGFTNRLKGNGATISLAKQKRRKRARAFPWAIRTAALAACIGSMIFVARSNQDRASIVRTEHLEFSSDKKDMPILKPLIESGDDNYAIVKAHFDPVNPGLRSRVVITEVFDQTGTLGVANWNMVRLGRDALGMADRFPLEELLRHELAHVFLESLSDGKLKRHFQAMQIFHEGVATWCQSLPDRKTLTPMQTHNVLRALTNERWNKPVAFSDILKGKGDPYGHGLMFADALTEEFGADSFREVASEVASLESKSIFYQGEAFWYLLCNRLGYSVELLETRYLKVKSDYEKQYSQILSLPKPELKFSWYDDEVVIRAKAKPNEMATLVFYVKTDGDTFLEEFVEPLAADDEGNLRLSFEDLKSLPHSDAGKIEYQAGWKIESLPLPLYGKSGQFPWDFRLEKNSENFVADTKVIRSSSDHAKDRSGAQAVDGSYLTYWHTKRPSDDQPSDKHPHELVIDLGESIEIKAFHYLVRQDSSNSWNGSFKDCEFLVSDDPGDFQTIAATAKFKKTRVLQTVESQSPVKGRFVLVRVLSEVNGEPWASAAEIIVERTGR